MAVTATFQDAMKFFPLQTRNNNTSSYVAVIQSFLWAYSTTWRIDIGSNGGTDGIWGDVTDKYVKEFQRLKGLTVDGEVGPNTWYAMANSLVPGKIVNPLNERMYSCDTTGDDVLIITNTPSQYLVQDNSVWSYYNRNAGRPVEFRTGI